MRKTYDFICDHLENIYPCAIPAMDDYLTAWIQDDVFVEEDFEDDLNTTIYPYLAAYRALVDVGVEETEKYIVDMRTEEVAG